MQIFKLPDLGEGLPDAEIHEWHVTIGDVVEIDQPLVSMETAKAVVDVPAPQAGKIVKLYGQTGDIIKTGAPLVEFASDQPAQPDKATVVGTLETSEETVTEHFIIGSPASSRPSQPKASPAVRALAKQLNIDLATVTPSQTNGVITAVDLQKKPTTAAVITGEPLRGVRRSMAHTMAAAHAEVAPVSLHDEVDIEHWPTDTDITVRLIQAITAAAQQEPTLNAWYDGREMRLQLHQHVNLGLAVDTEEGLFVPVIKQADQCSSEELRTIINEYKQAVADRSIAPESLHNTTLTLSNFGLFAGRHATPVVVPPTVAILAVGKIHQAVVADQGQPAIHRLLPLSLTVDHRAVTGGEAARFLACIIDTLAS